MSNDNFEPFDDFVGGILADIKTVDSTECLRFLEADEMAQYTKVETLFDLGKVLQNHQENIEGITPDDPDWVYAEDFVRYCPQFIQACILIGQKLAQEVRETKDDAELQEILDDARKRDVLLRIIYHERNIAKRLMAALLEIEDRRAKRKAAADERNRFPKKRRKRIGNLFKSVLTSIFLSVALTLIFRVASFDLMKSSRNNYKP